MWPFSSGSCDDRVYHSLRIQEVLYDAHDHSWSESSEITSRSARTSVPYLDFEVALTWFFGRYRKHSCLAGFRTISQSIRDQSGSLCVLEVFLCTSKENSSRRAPVWAVPKSYSTTVVRVFLQINTGSEMPYNNYI